jgi:hypothetical protein
VILCDLFLQTFNLQLDLTYTKDQNVLEEGIMLLKIHFMNGEKKYYEQD